VPEWRGPGLAKLNLTSRGVAFNAFKLRGCVRYAYVITGIGCSAVRREFSGEN
jgi:hypothetical protein